MGRKKGHFNYFWRFLTKKKRVCANMNINKNIRSVYSRGDILKMEMLKPPAESLYEKQLRALREEDTGKRPPNWLLSPAYVRDFIIGREEPVMLDGEPVAITRK